MKQAIGEANLIVVAIILIAVVVAVAPPLINSLMKTAAYRSCCTDAGAVWKEGSCRFPEGTPTSEWPNYSSTYFQCVKDNDLKPVAILK